MSIAATLFRNITSNWAGLALNLLITFFLSPFVVNTLGSLYYGIWALTGQLTGYMFLLDFGVRDSIIRDTARYCGLRQGRKLNRLLTTSLVVYAPIALAATAATAVAVVGFPYWFGIDEPYIRESRIALALVGLTIAQSFIFNTFTGILQGLQRFDIGNVIGVVAAMLRAALVVVALLNGYGIVGLSVIQFTLSILGGLATAYFSLRLLRREGLPFTLEWAHGRRVRALVRRVVGYSTYVFVNNIAGKIILATDAVVIGVFLPVASVTYYAIAGTLAGLATGLVGAAVWVLMPLVSHYAARRQAEEVRVLFMRASKMGLLVAAPVCMSLMILGREFISLWMGEEFAPRAAEVLVILAVAGLVSAPHHAMNAVLLGLGRHRTMAFLRLGEAAVNLTLSIWLVQRIGLPGVALGTLIPHTVVMLVALPAVTCRVVALPLRTYFAQAYARPLLAALPFAAGALVIKAWWPASNLTVFLTQVSLLVVPYAIGVYLIALTAAEKGIARDYAGRLFAARPSG